MPDITQPFIQEFEGDHSLNPQPRQTPNVLYSLVYPQKFPEAKIIHYNSKLGKTLGFEDTPTDLLTVNSYPKNIQPYATAYAGHQFGNWAGQLGDGRAIFIGETIGMGKKPTELQWKGAGLTPYSRHADGKAVLRSSIREYLMSEAMFHLGVPTTRALSLATTGEPVLRDMFYDGNPETESGAVVVRTSESFLRFGHFELLMSRGDDVQLKKLADWAIRRYFPQITDTSDKKYTRFFSEINRLTIEMIVNWYRVGFVHGVMNTDNMSILGLTIDYGPFSMLDEYDDNFTPNTTDLPGRRYSFGNQSGIAQWNLYQLANTLLPLNNDIEGFQEIINQFPTDFHHAYQSMVSAKMGWDFYQEKDAELLKEWHILMQELPIDYTLFFTLLKEKPANSTEKHFSQALYRTLSKEETSSLESFIEKYWTRIDRNQISRENRITKMNASNPKFILRNYLLYQCIEEVSNGKMELFNQLWEALQNPYESLYPELEQKRPNWANDTAGCAMLSCSS